LMTKDICLSHSKEGRRSGEEEAAVINQRVTRHGCFTATSQHRDNETSNNIST
jgi:hypothetical protein